MLLRCNIDRRGRLVRLAAGVLLGGVAVWRIAARDGAWNLAAALVLGVAALFVLFEAAAGWCAARACGLRTPF